MSPTWRVALLNNREREVLHHMMEGRCASQISEAMFISMTTTRTYIRNILWKLNVNSQLAAVAYVRRLQQPCDETRRAEVDAVLTSEESVA